MYRSMSLWLPIAQVRLAFCDHTKVQAGYLKEAFPDLGEGLPPGDDGVKLDIFHAIKRVEQLLNRRNSRRGGCSVLQL